MLSFEHKKRVLPATGSHRLELLTKSRKLIFSREKLAAFSMAGFTKHITVTELTSFAAVAVYVKIKGRHD